MLFWLSNTPTIVQNYIIKILAKKVDIFVIVYLNNIFTYIKDQCHDHVQAMQQVLDFLRKYSLFAN